MIYEHQIIWTNSCNNNSDNSISRLLQNGLIYLLSTRILLMYRHMSKFGSVNIIRILKEFKSNRFVILESYAILVSSFHIAIIVCAFLSFFDTLNNMNFFKVFLKDKRLWFFSRVFILTKIPFLLFALYSLTFFSVSVCWDKV